MQKCLGKNQKVYFTHDVCSYERRFTTFTKIIFALNIYVRRNVSTLSAQAYIHLYIYGIILNQNLEILLTR